MKLIGDAIERLERLRERLQTGWAPKASEIDPAVPQIDALNWEWIDDACISYQTVDRRPCQTGTVIYIDKNLTHALTAEGMFWLYDAEESEKVRFLGG